MKKAFKLFLITISSLIAFVIVYFAMAYVLSRISVNQHQTKKGDIPMYILTNGVHTDIVLPVKSHFIDWSRKIKFENTLRNDTTAQWIGFGWGDKGFYLETPTWADLKFSVAFKAMFGLSRSAIHATFYEKMKEGENSRLMYITHEQYKRLITYIQKSLQTGEDNMPVVIKTTANYGEDDAFYEAMGSYNLFHTCNTWSNNALKTCGQKACFWTPFDKGIFYHYPLPVQATKP